MFQYFNCPVLEEKNEWLNYSVDSNLQLFLEKTIIFQMRIVYTTHQNLWNMSRLRQVIQNISFEIIHVLIHYDVLIGQLIIVMVIHLKTFHMIILYTILIWKFIFLIKTTAWTILGISQLSYIHKNSLTAHFSPFIKKSNKFLNKI